MTITATFGGKVPERGVRLRLGERTDLPVSLCCPLHDEQSPAGQRYSCCLTVHVINSLTLVSRQKKNMNRIFAHRYTLAVKSGAAVTIDNKRDVQQQCWIPSTLRITTQQTL